MPIIRKIAPPERDEPDGPPPGFPRLTRDAIRAWLGEATLQRGAAFALGGDVECGYVIVPARHGAPKGGGPHAVEVSYQD